MGVGVHDGWVEEWLDRQLVAGGEIADRQLLRNEGTPGVSQVPWETLPCGSQPCRRELSFTSHVAPGLGRGGREF